MATVSAKFAYIGPFDSQDMIWRIVEQRGWGVGLVKGQFRLFDRTDILDAADIEVTITADDIVGDQDFVEVADLRPVLPRDGWSIEYGERLVDDAGSELESARHVQRCRLPGSRTPHE